MREREGEREGGRETSFMNRACWPRRLKEAEASAKTKEELIKTWLKRVLKACARRTIKRYGHETVPAIVHVAEARPQGVRTPPPPK